MSDKEIIAIINFINSLTFSEFELENGDFKVKFKREANGITTQSVQVKDIDEITDKSPPVEIDLPRLLAPISGTYYKAMSPDVQPFVSVGDNVEIGQTMCIIEAMKMMMEVKADKSGVIKEILVEDGETVQEHQPLFIFEI